MANTERDDPIQARNVYTTIALLDLAAAAGVRIFVGAGSQAEYGPYPRPIREDDATHPTSLYGHAKLAAGNMAALLADRHKIRFAWLRIFSAYGLKDNTRWLIPTLIRSLKAGMPMQLTACEQRWGFIHSRDIASAFRVAIENDRASGFFNVGASNAQKLREVVLWLRDQIAPGAPLGFGEIPYRSDQAMVLVSDTSRLIELGWEPKVALSDGLMEMIIHNASSELT